MGWFDQGAALDTSTPGWGGAPAAGAPGRMSGSDYLRALLMRAMESQQSPGLASLFSGAGVLPEMNGGEGAPSGPAGPTADEGVTNGEAQGDIAAAIGNAISGGRSGLVGLAADAAGVNPTLGFGPNGFVGGLSSDVNAAPNTFGLSLANLMSLAPSPISMANTIGGAIAGAGKGVSTRGGDFSGPFSGLFSGSPTAALGPNIYGGNNFSLSDAARGMDFSGREDLSDPSPTTATPDTSGPTPTEGDPTGQEGGPTGNGPSSSGIGPGTGTAPTGDEGDSGDGGGGGGGGGGASVICSELRRQGLMDDLIWAADERFGGLQTRAVRDGYRCWAQYIARGMKRSPLLTRIVARLAIPWAYEMAYLMGARSRGSLLGRALMFAGLPFCAVLGKFRSTWRTA